MTSARPLANPTYRRLFGAQVIALAGTGLATIALTLLAYDLAGDDAGAVVGIALALKMVVYVFGAPVITAVAGRLPRRRLLVALDVLRAGSVVGMLFVTEVWHVYVLIVLVNACSAGFTPTFQATIPDVLTDEPTYTRALSLSRIAYELESLLSPALAAALLAFVSYDGLFAANGVAFLCSAALVLSTALPARRVAAAGESRRRQITAGTRRYLATRRLRGLLALNIAVAAASAMVIVNTVIYVRDEFGRDAGDVAWALGASGAGAMLAALLLPRLLDRVPDRAVMLNGGRALAAGLALAAVVDGFIALLGVWFALGVGLATVQTPIGRIVTRSGSSEERPALFAAQFSLSHACWLATYPIAGVLGSVIGLTATASILAGIAAAAVLIAGLVWRADAAIPTYAPTRSRGGGSTFLRLLGFLGPYRGAAVSSVLLAAFEMGVTVAIPWLTGLAVDVIARGDRGTLGLLAGAVLLAALLRLALSVAWRHLSGRVAAGVELDLRNRIYEHLQALELGFFARQQTGQLMSRATVDLQSVRFLLGYGFVYIALRGLAILFAAVAMFLLQPGLAALALAPVPFVVLVATRYGRRSRPALTEVQQRIAELTADVEENVSGIRVVKAFAAEDRQLEWFQRSVGRVLGQSMLATRLRAFYNPFIGFLPNLGLAVILLVGGRQVMHGSLSLGDFTAFYAYLLMLIGPMRLLGLNLATVQRATASGARIFELLDREPRVVSPLRARPLPDDRGRVELRGVTFAYEGSPPALYGIDLVVEAGTTVALVGATGSGKSTLVQLLGRLYDVSQGAVLIDGVDVRELDLASLRRSIAVVGDDPFLFSASVHENIAYARPGASREEVERAAERAQAAGFIEALPAGYDTRVGERGLTLSGGQRQRIAIARALLADPRILVLDDATSSVDASTEQAIKEALREVMAGRTTFVIAHRLSTIALADEIVVLEGGRVAARGTHGELRERSGLYAEIAEKGLPDQVLPNRKPRQAVAGL